MNILYQLIFAWSRRCNDECIRETRLVYFVSNITIVFITVEGGFSQGFFPGDFSLTAWSPKGFSLNNSKRVFFTE